MKIVRASNAKKKAGDHRTGNRHNDARLLYRGYHARSAENWSGAYYPPVDANVCACMTADWLDGTWAVAGRLFTIRAIIIPPKSNGFSKRKKEKIRFETLADQRVL